MMPPPPSLGVPKPKDTAVVEVKEKEPAEIEMMENPFHAKKNAQEQSSPSLSSSTSSSLHQRTSSSLRKRRNTAVKNVREMRARRLSMIAKVQEKKSLSTAELNDVNIDARVKAVEGMFEESSANQSFWAFAKLGQGISYLMYFFLYLLSFPVVLPFACRCCLQGEQLINGKMRNFRKLYEKKNGNYVLKASETIKRVSVREELSYDGFPQSYCSNDPDDNGCCSGSLCTKLRCTKLRDWQPFQQASYEDFWYVWRFELLLLF